jgi:hypothetical protein
MEQIGRKYMIMDTGAKALLLDDQREPLRFASLEEALTKASGLRAGKAADAFAVVDDMGNKWAWSKKDVLRVALSYDTKDVIHAAIKVDWKKSTSIYSTRRRADGVVETSHQLRLPDGPPIPEMRFGRPSETMTTERWTEKAQWIVRDTLNSYIETLPTRIHKLEQRAINEKARVERTERKARLQLAAYEAGEEMTCQICGRLICSKRGEIAHHGYTRPGGGWQTSSCAGTHHDSLEVSNELLVEYIGRFESSCEATRSLTSDVQADRVEIEATISPHWSERPARPVKFRFNAKNYAAVSASSEGKLSDKVPFADRKESYLYALDRRLSQQKEILAELRKRNAGWKQIRAFVDGEFKPHVSEEAA